MQTLAPFLARFLSPFVALAFTWLEAKGINFDSATKTEAIGYLILVIIPSAQIVNGLAHKFLDKWINPGDSAASVLVQPDKDKVNALETGATAYRR